MDLVTYFERPKLREPFLVAAWPGMANVGVMAVGYLKDQLGARPLAEIGEGHFFAPTGALISNQVIKPPERSQNRFYYWHNATAKNDVVLFLGNVQPVPHREYEFAQIVLGLAKELGVRTIYTVAAAPTDMHFKDAPRVFAVPNHRDLLAKMSEYPVQFMNEGSISGLNGLLISAAADTGLYGVCLLGEIPFFTAQLEFPRASLKVLDVLTRLLRVRIDLLDLELFSNQKEKEIEPLAALLVKDDATDAPPREEGVTPSTEESVPQSIRLHVEKLFREAEFDRSYKSKMKLKEELDKWNLFDEYLDRFLDLFKKDKPES
jgi:uncharacterized protein